MSDWELFLGFVSAVLDVAAWSAWYSGILRVNKFAASRRVRVALAILPPICLLLFLTVIRRYAATTVRQNSFYTAYYAVVGAGWLGALTWVIPYLGISARDDVLERSNTAAAWSVGAALLAFAFCYAGGNVGEGPGLYAVLASSGLATASLLVLWFVLEVLSGHRVAESITVERNTGAGIRLAGLLLCNGAVLGTGAAGSWVPGEVLVRFGRFVWPTLLFTGIATIVERTWAPKLYRSMFIALAFVLGGSAYIVLRVISQ